MIAFYDIEVYPNYICIGFLTESGKVIQFDSYGKNNKINTKKLLKTINKYQCVGFNSIKYDDPVTTFISQGEDISYVHELSKQIVEEDLKHWDVYRQIGEDVVNSIDLIEVAPQSASLKLYGSRINTKKLQDLPYPPHTHLSKEQAENVKKYNVNDLEITRDLYNTLKPQLELRKKMSEQYGINLMSKSDAQIAEAIIRHELNKKGIKAKRGRGDTVHYKAPKAVKFMGKDLNDLVKRIEESPIELGKNGSPMLPKWLKDHKIEIGEARYNIGLGGLHSTEKSTAVIPTKGYTLGNVDVASFYPSLIVDLNLYPESLTKEFIRIYSKIKDTRLKAKAKGDKVTSDSLKIVLNGSYGKFGSPYSFLYSPHLMLTTTFTGQLYLLMLIEKLESTGKFKVVSSNTDGIEILYKKKHQGKLEKIVSKWEKRTHMVMEYGQYNALYSRDVNNYVAVYDGYAKAKGAYGDPYDPSNVLKKNIEYPIVFEAIREFLVKGTPFEVTLRNCSDIAMFCCARSVTGGAIYGNETLPNTEEYEEYIKRTPFKQNKALEKRNAKYQAQFVLDSDKSLYLGKVVRWYYSTDGSAIFYKKSGNKVPKTDGARPMMDLTESIPSDLDYNKYNELCTKHLQELGY